MTKLREIINNTRVTKIKIIYNKEQFSFNLTEELSINPAKINAELKEQPSHYGFLLLLRNRLLTVKEDKERQADKIYANLYSKYSESINPKTNKYYADKAAQQKVLGSTKYNDAKEISIKAKQDYNDINSCVMAFEQRANLIQSLSSNLRNEK